MLAMLIGLSGFVLLIGLLESGQSSPRPHDGARARIRGPRRARRIADAITTAAYCGVAPARTRGGGACSDAHRAVDHRWLSPVSIGESGERIIFAFDWRVFAWAFGAASVTARRSVSRPRSFALRLKVNETLKSGARGMTGGRGHQRFRHASSSAQFALAMILLTGAALYIRGLDDLNNKRAAGDPIASSAGRSCCPRPATATPRKSPRSIA